MPQSKKKQAQEDASLHSRNVWEAEAERQARGLPPSPFAVAEGQRQKKVKDDALLETLVARSLAEDKHLRDSGPKRRK